MPYLLARAEEHRGVELFVGRVEVHKQLKNLLLDLLNAGIGLVYLVDNDNDAVVQLKRTLKDKTRLRHRSLGCVDKQQNAVDHLQNSLDLAAEVRVTGGVYDVDLYALVVYGGVLCKNGNAALALKVI